MGKKPPSKAKKAKKKQKLQNFKQQQKRMNEQQKTPRTHLQPTPVWKEDDKIPVEGRVLDALQNTIVSALESLNQAGNALNYLINKGIEDGVIKVEYNWNNGEPASEKEVEDYLKAVAEYRAQQEAYQKQLKQTANAEKTGLVAADGSPLGSDQDLDTEQDAPQSDYPDSPVASPNEAFDNVPTLDQVTEVVESDTEKSRPAISEPVLDELPVGPGPLTQEDINGL